MHFGYFTTWMQIFTLPCQEVAKSKSMTHVHTKQGFSGSEFLGAIADHDHGNQCLLTKILIS